MIRRRIVISAGLLFVLFLLPLQVRAQAPTVILHNGNIITMEDKLASASVESGQVLRPVYLNKSDR